jgi:GDP-L-fucose synthase
MELNGRIYVAGHTGLVGSSVVRNLRAKGYQNLILKTHRELDLCDQAAVNDFFKKTPIDYIIHAGARVGGILYNQRFQAEFLYENIMIAANVIHAAYEHNVQKLLFLGSSCIYPKLSTQPIVEEALLTGPLEPTNEGYAMAKIAGLKLCEKYNVQYSRRFISVMPTNLYGEGDSFHPEHSHVIPGMMRRFHEAKINNAPQVVIWGSGKPMREFLYVDDLAEALFVLMQKYDAPGTINVGTGEDCTIRALAETMREVVGYRGEIVLDASKPDGTPRKVLNVDKMKALGWAPTYSLRAGLEKTYEWALKARIFG